MLPEYFAVIGAVIASLGGLRYLYDTLKGRTKPNRVTWLLWGTLPLIIFVAQQLQGVEALSLATLAASVPPLIIFAASFLIKKAYWQTGRLDYVCFGLALVGLTMWFVSRDANQAIAWTIAADIAAGAPTVLKAYRQPKTESWPAFAVSAFGFALCLLAIPQWTFEYYAFVLSVLCMNTLICALALNLPVRFGLWSTPSSHNSN